MKISDIEGIHLEEYCGISDGIDATLLEAYKTAAIAFIMSYTGLKREELDEHEDITIACLCLVNDMYSERDYKVDRTNLNPTVETILSMHSRNYL